MIDESVVCLPSRRERRTEGDIIVCGSACERAGAIVVRIAVSSRARNFEVLRVTARFASVGRRVRSTAAVLWFTKRVASTVARNILPIATHPELSRAGLVQVNGAPSIGAVPAILVPRCHQHREVVAVYEADIIEIETVGRIEGELCEGSRRNGSCTRALYGSRAAVTGQAGESGGGGVLGAEGASPETS